MAENTSQFALGVRKCLHWALCLRQSACAKGIVSDSAGSYAQHPESSMESRGACGRGKSCNSCNAMVMSQCQVRKRDTGKATKLVVPALQNCGKIVPVKRAN